VDRHKVPVLYLILAKRLRSNEVSVFAREILTVNDEVIFTLCKLYFSKADFEIKSFQWLSKKTQKTG
jgi:hypothetical protein